MNFTSRVWSTSCIMWPGKFEETSKAGNEEELTISRVNCATADSHGARPGKQTLEVNTGDGWDSSQSGFVSSGWITQSLLCYSVVSQCGSIELLLHNDQLAEAGGKLGRLNIPPTQLYPPAFSLSLFCISKFKNMRFLSNFSDFFIRSKFFSNLRLTIPPSKAQQDFASHMKNLKMCKSCNCYNWSLQEGTWNLNVCTIVWWVGC